MMSDANGLALVFKGHARDHLAAMRARVAKGEMNKVPSNHQDWASLRAAQTWLNIHVGRRTEFLDTVDAALQLIDDSIALNVQLIRRHGRDTASNCVDCNMATAIVGDTAGVINHCDLFFKRGPLCRRDLNMHERFHLVGVANHGQPANTGPADALNNVQNLVELVRDVNQQSNGHCGAGR